MRKYKRLSYILFSPLSFRHFLYSGLPLRTYLLGLHLDPWVSMRTTKNSYELVFTEFF